MGTDSQQAVQAISQGVDMLRDLQRRTDGDRPPTPAAIRPGCWKTDALGEAGEGPAEGRNNRPPGARRKRAGTFR